MHPVSRNELSQSPYEFAPITSAVEVADYRSARCTVMKTRSSAEQFRGLLRALELFSDRREAACGSQWAPRSINACLQAACDR